jgi:hypothetical protein
MKMATASLLFIFSVGSKHSFVNITRVSRVRKLRTW